ncbi:hypothetical protein DL98DRAFT_199660 [Cadophora sp. DSE1049]|nr:hypothetical protein DL98DRAFT_199660 [Cadophora sp. DSE1049]
MVIFRTIRIPFETRFISYVQSFLALSCPVVTPRSFIHLNATFKARQPKLRCYVLNLAHSLDVFFWWNVKLSAFTESSRVQCFESRVLRRLTLRASQHIGADILAFSIWIPCFLRNLSYRLLGSTLLVLESVYADAEQSPLFVESGANQRKWSTAK